MGRRFYIKRTPDGLPTKMLLDGKWKPVERIALHEDDDLADYEHLIDWNTQGLKIIKNKVEPILKAYGISVSEVMSGQKQMTLGGFK